MLQLRQLFQLIDKSINLFLLAIGVYFIYYGGILEKFTNGYTNFAEGEEEVHELPTILTHIQYEEGYEFLEYGRHFNISYQALGSTTNPQNLTEGINTIDESGLKVNFEVQKEFSSLHKYAKSRQHFKITPINFSPSNEPPMPVNFRLKYSSGNSSGYRHLLYRIGVALTPENNSWCGVGYYDGEEKDVFTKGGQEITINMSPLKFAFNRDTDKCRIVPYNEILYEKLSQRISKRCSKPCRYPNYWLCSYMKKLEDLPICKDENELKCYTDVMNEIKETLSKKLKPCTKLQYKYESSMWLGNKNEVNVEIKFPSPPIVKTKREYLIYDLVSMISAIGGTMGLCIGFSFRECSSFILNCLDQAIKRFKGPNDEKIIWVKEPTSEYADELKHHKLLTQLIRQEERFTSIEQELRKLNKKCSGN